MVLATGSAQNSSANDILLKTTTPSVSSASFTQQLAAALEQYLGQPGNASGLEIDIQPSQSQNSGGSQFLVTVKSANSSPAAAAQSSTPNSIPMMIQSVPASLTSAAKTSPAASADHTSTPTDGANTGGTSSTTTPAGYENVPFGLSSTTVPELDTELAAVNKQNALLAQINPGALSTAAAQAGDPMSGTTIPGTNLKWDDLTQNQQLAFQHAMLCGLPKGQTMDQFLASYVGPSEWWNASYSKPNMFGTPPAASSVTMYNSPYTPTTA